MICQAGGAPRVSTAMYVVPGPAIAGALIISVGFPLILLFFAHAPFRLPRSGVRFQVAAGSAAALFVLWCLFVPAPRESADVIAGALLLMGTLLIWFNVWSVLVWGFTLSLLTTLAEAKHPLTRTQWIAAFAGDESVFAQDRLRLLYALRAAEVVEDRVRISLIGTLIARGANLARRVFGMR